MDNETVQEKQLDVDAYLAGYKDALNDNAQRARQSNDSIVEYILYFIIGMILARCVFNISRS